MGKLILSTFFVDAIRKELCSQEMPNSDLVWRELETANDLLSQSCKSILDNVGKGRKRKRSSEEENGNVKQEIGRENRPTPHYQIICYSVAYW